MIPYEDFIDDISIGDQIQVTAIDGDFSGKVLDIKTSSVKINDGDSEIRIYFERMIMYRKTIQKPTTSESKPVEKESVLVETVEQPVTPEPISQPIPQPIQVTQPTQQIQPTPPLQQSGHDYKIMPLDQFYEELKRATKAGYANKKRIDSLLSSFTYAKKIHEDKLGKNKMDNIISQIRKRISINPADRYLVLLMGILLHHCGRDDLAEKEFQNAYKLLQEKQSRREDPNYIEENTLFVGKIHAFKNGIITGSTKISWFGFLDGETLTEPKKSVQNLYFNVSQVSDPEFRRLLMGQNYIDKKISFKIGWRRKGIEPFPAADDIRIYRCTGVIKTFALHVLSFEYSGDAGKILDDSGQIQTFNLTNVVDPYLRAYLMQHDSINFDNQEFRVSFVIRTNKDDKTQIDEIFSLKQFSDDEMSDLRSSHYIKESDLKNWEIWKKNSCIDVTGRQKIIDINYKPLIQFKGKLPDEVVNERPPIFANFDEDFDPWSNYDVDPVDNNQDDPYSRNKYQDWIDSKIDSDETVSKIFLPMYDEFRNVFVIISNAEDKRSADSLVKKVCNKFQPIVNEPLEKSTLKIFDFNNADESFDSFLKKIVREEKQNPDQHFFVMINSFSGEKIDKSGINGIFDRIENSQTNFFIVFTKEPKDFRFKQYFEQVSI